jgi:cold shock CspA family protein
VGGPVPAPGPRAGRVTSFDARRGIGTVADVDGTPFDFHATAIADGSRAIDEGAEVSFTVVPGHRGRYEAQSIEPSPTRPA